MSVKSDWKIIKDEIVHGKRATTRPTDTEMSLRLLLVVAIVIACILVGAGLAWLTQFIISIIF